MIEITHEIYRTVAGRLRERIGEADFFNGTVEIETGGLYATLTLAAIIRRCTETLPEGTRKPIAGVVPVWWEFSTVQPDGDVVNDFSFSEFKKHLIHDL